MIGARTMNIRRKNGNATRATIMSNNLLKKCLYIADYLTYSLMISEYVLITYSTSSSVRSVCKGSVISF